MTTVWNDMRLLSRQPVCEAETLAAYWTDIRFIARIILWNKVNLVRLLHIVGIKLVSIGQIGL
jgi:hypothetical protein